MKEKIVRIEELADIAKKHKERGEKVVHCHGVFDLLHIGHIRHFEQAKKMGELLIVTVTPDRYVDKGSHRPAFTEVLRAEAVASLWCVDYVAINKWPTAEETLRMVRPDVYVKGSEFKNVSSDMTGKIGKEAKVIKEVGAELAFTEEIVFSSTTLINQFISAFPKEVQEYLELFRNRHSLEDVLSVIDNMEELKVLVIGDVIIDEYVYCEAIGKSSKDPVLAVKYGSEDRFAGGVLAVANHIANFAGHVELLTVTGRKNNYQEFIESHINKKIVQHYFTEEHMPTVVKRRLVEGYSLNKLLEIYVMDEQGIPSDLSGDICEFIKQRANDFDLILVADFGHGMITDEVIQTLCEYAPFLAVNTQANAGNRGFHTVTRYPSADYVCIAEHEIRLETRDAHGELRPLMERIVNQLHAKQMVVTCGKKGCLVATDDDEFIAVPATAKKVVDRVGAGDAFLSVTALAAAQNVNLEILGFIGNLVGAQAVETVGNDKSIDKLKIKKHIVSLMK